MTTPPSDASRWREWIHMPWHCPYCLVTGFLVGQLVMVIALAGLALR